MYILIYDSVGQSHHVHTIIHTFSELGHLPSLSSLISQQPGQLVRSHLHCRSELLGARQTVPTAAARWEPGSQDQTSGWVSSALWSSSSEPSAWTPRPGSLHSSPGCQALKCDSSGVVQEPGLQGPSGSDPISPRELAG